MTHTTSNFRSLCLSLLFGVSAFALNQAAGAQDSASSAADNSALLDSGGGRYDPPEDEVDPASRAEMLSSARAMRRQLGLTPSGDPGSSNSAKGVVGTASTAGTRLAWPVRPGVSNRNDFQAGVSNYIDLDEAPGSLLDYACGTRTYDLNSGYNHDGIDIASWPFPWTTMDADGLDVIAAADGTIVAKIDGRFDRSCSSDNTQGWNAVVLAHSDGKQTVYGHLKKNSLTSKAVGDTVVAGEFLGQVGSSGISTGPHLHFELLDSNGNNMDPFEGACGAQAGHWRWQPEYNHPRINAVLVGHAAPEIGQCDGSEAANLATEFYPGDPVYISAYFVNQPSGEAATLQLVKPDGSVFLDAALGAPPEDFEFSYWYSSVIAPSISGKWRAIITLGGESSETGFSIGEPAEEGLLVAAVLPGSRSVGLNQPASIFATMANGGQSVLEGCRVLPLGPFAGQLQFQATDPSTNQLVGEPNQPVSIPVGGASSFVLTLNPSTTVEATNIEFNFKCNNAPRAGRVRGLNTLQFSASATATADILPISATQGGDGVIRLGGPAGATAFGTAALNIGTSVTNVRVVPEALGLDLTLSVCETDAKGTCKSSPADSVLADFRDAARTFSVFVFGNGDNVPFDPANNRVELRFEHEGQIRGVTSVAVTSD